jgi:hypothetical protein
MQKQTQLFENQTNADILIDVEVYPDRYVLKPGDVFEITYEHDGKGYGLHTNIYPNGSLQIYLQEFDTAVVTINGKIAEPWTNLTPEQRSA